MSFYDDNLDFEEGDASGKELDDIYDREDWEDMGYEGEEWDNENNNFQATYEQTTLVGMGKNESVNLRDRRVAMNLSDDAKFKIYMTIIYNSLKEPLNLNANDLEYMLDKVVEMKDIFYKSPAAFVLGYSVIQNKKINKNKFDAAVKLGLPEINKQSNIQPEDILKYARYIIAFL